MVADGWNRLTRGVTLAVIGSSWPARSSVPVNDTVLDVGSGSPGCTVRVTKMVRLSPGFRGMAFVPKYALLLAVIEVTNGLTPAAPGCFRVWLTTMLPSKVSWTLWMKRGEAPVFCTVSG